MEKILMIFVLLLCIYILGTLPRFTRKKETKTFCHCLFAHRGLFTPDQRIPENSMRAFQEAVRHGYGIELDIQRTKDNQIVVFHDHTLSRMCGIDLPVCELTYKELQKLTLMNSTEKIPLFQDVLDLVNGQVPLLIEIKLPTVKTLTCRLADELLQNYSGKYCIESFNPLALRWYKKNRKEIIRGQLSANLTRPVAEGGYFLSFLVKYLLLNFLGKPDFISCCYKDRYNISFLLQKYIYKTPVFAWTVRSSMVFKKQKDCFDSIIFDSFIPVKEC